MSEELGRRPLNDWGHGDLPAPWCPGDLVRRVNDDANERLRGDVGSIGDHWWVTCVYSIDEGDAWYCRVRRIGRGPTSDRLHVIDAGRSTIPGAADWMSAFQLIETPDPEGLAKRNEMLANGWTLPPRTYCPTCGHELREATT